MTNGDCIESSVKKGAGVCRRVAGRKTACPASKLSYGVIHTVPWGQKSHRPSVHERCS